MPTAVLSRAAGVPHTCMAESFSPASGSPSVEHFSTDSNEEHCSQDQKLLSPPSKLQIEIRDPRNVAALAPVVHGLFGARGRHFERAPLQGRVLWGVNACSKPLAEAQTR